MHFLVGVYAKDRGLTGHTATHAHVELSANVPIEQSVSHATVLLSANQSLGQF